MPYSLSAPDVPSTDFSDLKSILDAAGTMIVATDADGIVRIFNPAAERLLGWRADEVVGKQTPAIWHVSAEVAARAAELSHKLGRTVKPGQDFFRTSCLEGNGQPSEWTLVRKDGSTCPVQLSVSALRDSVGRVTGFVGTAQDLTDRVRAEEALRRSEQNLAITLDAIGDAVIATDAARRVARMNPAAEQMTGWTQSEAAGRPIDEVFHIINEGTRRRAIIPVDAVLESGVIQGLANHTVLISRDGTEWPIADSAAPIRDAAGKIAGIVLIFRDVADERGLERTIQQLNADLERRVEERTADLVDSERRFSSLFEFSPDAIVLSNSDGIIIQANQQVATLFGWLPDELLGQPVEALMPAELRTGHPSLRKRYLDSAVPRAMGSGRNDLLGLRKDGSVFPVDVSLSPMQTPKGLLVAAAVRDATERLKVLRELQSAAEKLQEANTVIEQDRAQLADRVAERTAELTAANDELIQASRFKSEFLASMSHELRTPLNGVLGMNELLLKTSLTDKQREFIDASSTSGRALLSLINDVLDISKIEAGKIELDLHVCDLEAMAYDVITMFSHRAKQKGVSLSCRLDPEACVTVMCDDTRVRQILVNLLGNALKFTASGSVTLETTCVQRDERRIVVRLAVTDTGLGIPDDKLNLLFSPFAQVDRSTARHFGGTGLGLSITKQLVEMMGGTVGVTSRAGIGSTFWIELPLELVKSEIRAVKRRQRLEGTKVLVVNGVENERRQIAVCLKDWGCPCEHVSTLREAIDAVTKAEATSQPIDVVLAECSLAVGDEFVHLQKLARRRYPPVIGLGISESNDIANLLHLFGLRHLLDDPIRPSALFNVLTSLLAVTPSTATSGPKPDTTANEQATTFSGHILVAEDNSINQMFVRELLKHCGCTCDIVNNGDEALTALQQHRYELALMDCQMPEMDGFTATREIRRRETVGELPGHLPIIALTANALKGDRELCLEAGMDEYLSKPLQASQLQTILAKYLTSRFAELMP